MNSEIVNTENRSGTERKAYLKPNYEIRNENNAYLVDIHMPGVSRENVDISLNGEMLTIEASRVPYRHSEWKPLHT